MIDHSILNYVIWFWIKQWVKIGKIVWICWLNQWTHWCWKNFVTQPYIYVENTFLNWANCSFRHINGICVLKKKIKSSEEKSIIELWKSQKRIESGSIARHRVRWSYINVCKNEDEISVGSPHSVNEIELTK